MLPKISIITPAYNCGRYIRCCIDSINAQDYPNVEHVIMDGGSTDDTVQILKQYSHLIWTSERDEGECDALNKALKKITGDIVLWLNADDWLEPGVLHDVVRMREQQGGMHIIYGNTNMVDEDGRLLWIKSSAPGADFHSLIRWWLSDTHPHQPSMFFAREIIEDVGPFDQTLHFSIDYEYWLRCSTKYGFRHLDRIFSNARQRIECKSASTEPQQIQSHWKVLLPYLAYLNDYEQVRWWSEYYMQRAAHPSPHEPTRLPDTVQSLAGLLVPAAQLGAEQLLDLLFHDPVRRDEARALMSLSGGVAELTERPAQKKLERALLFMQTRGNGAKIAGADDSSGKDLTQIDHQSDFAQAIRWLFREFRPTKIIETGTYLGQGTTRVIAGAIRDNQLPARFFSIEVNPSNHREALANLSREGLINSVTLLRGLSLPRHMLPSLNEIQERFVTRLEADGIFVDHAEQERAQLYHQETDFSDCPDNLLESCLREFDYRPDFVLLDSGGHIGSIEFQHLLSRLAGPCFVALDDVFHVKHHQSYRQILSDKRFTVLRSSQEKFGFCLARFEPEGTKTAAEPAVPHKAGKTDIGAGFRRILFVRPDSIGDNLLAASALEPLKGRYPNAAVTVVCRDVCEEIYQSSPYVSQVISFNEAQLMADESYRNAVLQRISAFQPDLALNGVYSRTALSDLLTFGGGAPERIAFAGDLNNITAEARAAHDKFYTKLIPGEIDSSELGRHAALLRALGIDAPLLKPTVWLREEDRLWAENFFKGAGFDPAKTIVLFAGAQYDVRLYEHYGEALRDVCARRNLSVVTLGASQDLQINDRNLAASAARGINMSGKTTLGQAGALLQGAALAVGAETGLAHLACAVGTPNVVLLGGGHFGRFMPYDSLTTVVCLPLDCYGCNWRCRFGRTHCVKDVRREAVTAAVEAALGSPAQKIRFFVHRAERNSRDYPAWLDLSGFLPADLCEVILVGVTKEAEAAVPA